MAETDFDIVVIGADAAALPVLQRSAMAGLTVASFLPQEAHPAELLSQSLRSLNSRLARQSSFNGQFIRLKPTPQLLRRMFSQAVCGTYSELHQQLSQLGAFVFQGLPKFAPKERSGHHVLRWRQQTITSKHVILATGLQYLPLQPCSATERFWRQVQPHGFRNVQMRFMHEVFELPELPARSVIVGGHEFGAHMATLLQCLGVSTTLLAEQSGNSVAFEMAECVGVRIQPGVGTEVLNASHNAVFDLRRVQGLSRDLDLDAIGITPDESGQLWCGDGFETWCPRVFGAGSLVGFTTESATAPDEVASRILARIHRLPLRPHLLRRYKGLDQLAGQIPKAV